jgi:hypothetical protein
VVSSSSEASLIDSWYSTACACTSRHSFSNACRSGQAGQGHHRTRAGQDYGKRTSLAWPNISRQSAHHSPGCVPAASSAKCCYVDCFARPLLLLPAHLLYSVHDAVQRRLGLLLTCCHLQLAILLHSQAAACLPQAAEVQLQLSMRYVHWPCRALL